MGDLPSLVAREPTAAFGQPFLPAALHIVWKQAASKFSCVNGPRDRRAGKPQEVNGCFSLTGPSSSTYNARQLICDVSASSSDGDMDKRPSILIIEPRHSTRTFLEMTLCHEGMRVFSAVNLSSALLQLRVLQPDLIIIGLGRPELEASDAAAQIKSLSHSPLLALGHGNGAALGVGFAGVLPYPFGPGQLCAEIAGLLGRPCASYPGRSRKVTVGRSTEHLIQDIAWTIGEEVNYESA